MNLVTHRNGVGQWLSTCRKVVLGTPPHLPYIYFHYYFIIVILLQSGVSVPKNVRNKYFLMVST